MHGEVFVVVVVVVVVAVVVVVIFILLLLLLLLSASPVREVVFFFVVMFVSAFTTWFDVNTLSSAERNLARASGSFAHVVHVCTCDSHR